MRKAAILALATLLLATACVDLRSPANGRADAVAQDGDATVDEPSQEQANEDSGVPDESTSTQADSTEDAPVRQASGDLGPDGTHWPDHTPRYTTPATMRVTSLGDLNDALASASSGEVIEVSPHEWSQDLTVANGDASWERNVLVRPPLGERQSVVVTGELTLDAPHVTLAGFTLEETWRARSGANRSAYARMVVGANVAGYFDSTRDFGLYEIVAPEYGYTGDRMQIKATGGADNVNTVVSGVWLKGKFRRVGADDHSDTIQTFGADGNQVNGLKIIDSVLWTSADKTMQAALRGLIVRNTYFGECSTNPEQPSSGLECPGHHAIRDGGRQVEMYDVVVSGSVANDLPYTSIRNMKAQKVMTPPIDSRGLLVDEAFVEDPPPLPDLDSIWN